MSSDRYPCAGCEKYWHELDMHKDINGKFLCKECFSTITNKPGIDMQDWHISDRIPKRPEIRASLGPLPDKSHYRHAAIDPCQYVEAMGTAEFRGACVLNILKYITRYPHKGTPLMDLAKAQDYLTMLIEHEKKKATASTQEEDKRR